MNDVIKHQLSFLWKRFVFGLNKEFSRVTWWSKKRTFLDFAIIIIIVTILALIFMGLDMAVLPIEHYK
jgi:preprotein translocase SecE subunit